MEILNEIINQSIHRIELNVPRIGKCVNELSDEEVWKKPNESSNSAGNLILHICGNMTQYIISSLGHNEDKRKRDEEFAATGGISKVELLEKLSATAKQAVEVLRNTNENELLRLRKVQGFDISGIAIIVHVVEHFSYHTGQIVFWTKMLKDKDLGFYKGMDLNKKNIT